MKSITLKKLEQLYSLKVSSCKIGARLWMIFKYQVKFKRKLGVERDEKHRFESLCVESQLLMLYVIVLCLGQIATSYEKVIDILDSEVTEDEV